MLYMRTFLILIVMLTGCASGPSNWFPGFSSRTPPELDLGQEIVLSKQSAKAVTSLIGSDGYVHLFIVNEAGDIHHIAVSGDRVVSDQLIGPVAGMVDLTGNPFEWLSIDAIEHPRGTLHLAANGVQYIRRTPVEPWQRFDNGRCTRFLAFKEKLYCAFVVKGEEIGSAPRIDRTFGLFIVMPLYWSEEKRSDKLVLAEEYKTEWVIRAIVDPNQEFDVDPDFLANVDSSGTIHLFYFGSRGGGGVAVIGGRGGGGAFSFAAPSNMRFAQVSVEALTARLETEAVGAASKPARGFPLMIEGGTPTKMPFIRSRDVPEVRNPTAWPELRPLTQQLSFDPRTGQIRGLMDGRLKTYKDLHRGNIGGDYMEVSIKGGQWINHTDIVAGDIPADVRWMRYPEPIVRVDRAGRMHALLIARGDGSKTSSHPCNVAYFVERQDGWSSPIIIGACSTKDWRLWALKRMPSSERSLVFTKEGQVFASWVSEKGYLVGRWLSPRPTD